MSGGSKNDPEKSSGRRVTGSERAVMAGKFVSIEEAARLLGVSIDEVHRLVDRKKLFPMRDGAALKFRVDEIERLVGASEDDSSRSESLDLDLDLPTPGGDDLAIDVGEISRVSGLDAGSQTLVRGGAGGGPVGGLSDLALGDDDASSDGGDLELESIVGASSPSLARSAPPSGSVVGSGAGGDPLTLDLSGIAAGGSNAQPGSHPTGSGFAAPVDSGLSLEDGGIVASGIDLDVGAAPGSGMSDVGGSLAGGSLAGDAFDLGADVADDDSASVVIATEESGDSSFFANAIDDSASVAFGESSITDNSSSSILGAEIVEPVVEMGFSAWQIAGLVCCSLLLLAGGFVMYDLAWTIRTPQGTPVSAPLLNALGSVLGWRG